LVRVVPLMVSMSAEHTGSERLGYHAVPVICVCGDIPAHCLVLC
jgi:hypothetical protein